VSLQLNHKNLSALAGGHNLHLPPAGYEQLPEKVLQFGTGVLLRGLPDYFIDRANRKGIFNGRVVMVKSTSAGDTRAYDEQDCLYTIAERGIVGDNREENYWVNSAISRVLNANNEWDKVLACAANPDIQIIISNTTEVGIVYKEEKIDEGVPESFPGKLLAFLVHRFRHFKGDPKAGMVIVPTELLSDNGERLKGIVLQLAQFNKLETAFIQWLQQHNHFCNTLVDRIVPGKPPAAEWEQICNELGYRDDLMISAEPFSLWAIESGSIQVAETLSFAEANEGMIIAERIEKFRELKLRLLNGTHSFCCGLAWLAGYSTVKEALSDEHLYGYVRRLMILEIAATLDPELVSYNEACAFANIVLDRFRNPYLQHQWLSISMNYTSKMRMRNIPLLQRYYQLQGKAPQAMATGFAAYILFMNCEEKRPGLYVGRRGEVEYSIQDESAHHFSRIWKNADAGEVVKAVMGNKAFWGQDLNELPGWTKLVTAQLELMQREGAMAILRAADSIQTNQ
jgi:tagaturonate reductase